MIVCICHQVSDRELKRLFSEGKTRLGEIARSCRAGTDCGACASQIRELAERAQRVGTPSIAK
ncbi:MAG: (2Fe-2S)-binding protein [Myxococcota bacterium]